MTSKYLVDTMWAMNALIEIAAENQIPLNMIYMLLVIPLIVTIATFGRHVIGMKLLGIYEFTIMSIAIGFFLKNSSWVSLAIGAVAVAMVFFISYLLKKVTINLNLHYFSRISIILSLISLLFVMILLLIGRFPNIIEHTKINEISPFAFASAIILSESFSSTQSQKGFKKARYLFLSTLLITLGVGALISWNSFEEFMLNYPFISIFFVIGTLFIGRYKGIRLLEFLRFTDMKFDDNE